MGVRVSVRLPVSLSHPAGLLPFIPGVPTLRGTPTLTVAFWKHS